MCGISTESEKSEVLCMSFLHHVSTEGGRCSSVRNYADFRRYVDETIIKEICSICCSFDIAIQ